MYVMSVTRFRIASRNGVMFMSIEQIPVECMTSKHMLIKQWYGCMIVMTFSAIDSSYCGLVWLTYCGRIKIWRHTNMYVYVYVLVARSLSLGYSLELMTRDHKALYGY